MDNNIANNFNLLAEEIKRRPILTEYLTPAKKGFICLCGNGSGDDGTGAVISKDGNRLLCGKCQKGYSNIDIIAQHLGIGTSGKDFIEVVKFGCHIFGLSFNDDNNFSNTAQEKKTMDTDLQNLILSDIKNSKAHISKLPEFEKRGLTDYTLDFFQVGVDFDWTPPQKRLQGDKSFSSPRLIIPHLPHSKLKNIPLTYCAALFTSERNRLDAQNKSYIKYLYGGNRTPFGLNTLKNPRQATSEAPKQLVFITEGEFDAMSIWQALKGEYGVLATGGTADNGIVDALKNFYPNNKPNIYFAADNDDAGISFAADLCNKLSAQGFNAHYFTFSDSKSDKFDANKILLEYDDAELLPSLIQIQLDSIAKNEKNRLFGESFSNYFLDNFQPYIDENKKFADRKTGFVNLDDELNSFLPGVYIVGGLPALGKTTFCLQLLDKLASNGNHCIYVSYEMVKGFLYSKLLAREVARIETNNFLKQIAGKDYDSGDVIHRLTATQISLGKINPFHKKSYDEALRNFTKDTKPLFIWEENEIDIGKLLTRLENICNTLEKPPVVCIDYLQLLAAGSENIKTALDSVLHKIFAFRRKTNTTFIVISSLNRANYQTEISFESFKESGSIEYSADAIWGLQLLLDKRTAADAEQAKKEIPRKIQFKCLKNRFGSNFDIGFFYYPNCDTFLPMLDYGPFTDSTNNNSVSAPADESQVNE